MSLMLLLSIVAALLAIVPFAFTIGAWWQERSTRDTVPGDDLSRLGYHVLHRVVALMPHPTRIEDERPSFLMKDTHSVTIDAPMAGAVLFEPWDAETDTLLPARVVGNLPLPVPAQHLDAAAVGLVKALTKAKATRIRDCYKPHGCEVAILRSASNGMSVRVVRYYDSKLSRHVLTFSVQGLPA